MSRRAVLAGLLGMATGAPCAARVAPGAPRVVALDWGWAETLVALGLPPVAVVERGGYRATVVEPALPDTTFDLGVHTEPSLERLYRLKPDVIVITPALESLRHLVEPIAPVVSLGIFPAGGDAFRRAGEQTLVLARHLGIEAAASRFLGQALDELAAMRRQAGGIAGPLCIVRIVDARHGVVFGRSSLLHGVIDRLGLDNAWQAPTNAYGTLSIGLENLAALPGAGSLVSISNGGPANAPSPAGPLWQALPFVRDGRVFALPSVWGFGAVPSAMRFARLLVAAAAQQGRG